MGLFKRIEIWRAPATPLGAAIEFAPFQLVARLVGHHDNVTHLCWAEDSRRLLSASDDGTVKLFGLEFFDKPEGCACKVSSLATFSAHSERIRGCFIISEDLIYVMTRDSRITAWKWVPFESAKDATVTEDAKMEEEEETEEAAVDESGDVKMEEGEEEKEVKKEGENNNDVTVRAVVPGAATKRRERKKRMGKWTIGAKYNVGININQKVKCCVYHNPTKLMIVGFAVKEEK